ncbi:MAG: hypothetical protein GW779_05015 [Candidatus Altiarchaeum hamiconexum]|uniref:Uncharacterized protein n=1 Tax=Candidatus Altarchaeum hamiconexum TaxID=1803513 RepID=A0A8J7YXN3_9ARCH|nr:hypothetical protein [Candidatus Altarchaeum hamiconexum]NCN69296.1 hypothetical protein [Candidatus Altarchaeum hamiconexum]NCS91748.1 hypothetical protein [Candidatus Altarchaeum hamiconexum]NCS91750.1 hypothetical protein [Candidatus Altarchaeum hamiconexum]NCT00855.1 hypothetical protein [Candidatus Altarchaeum hamiconexum]
MRFVEAGDFYIGEMEMRRKNIKFFGKAMENIVILTSFENIVFIHIYYSNHNMQY